jgi:hypothetical protein
MDTETTGRLSDAVRSSDVREHARGALDVSLGVVLVVIGALFIAQQLLGFDPWRWIWPLLIVLPGVAFLVAATLGGRPATGLAIPGTITTTLGLLLLFQNTFNVWQTWAYAWALIFPTAVGLGIWLHGWLDGRVTEARTGRYMATIGLWLFLGLATFFEVVLNLSGTFARGTAGTVLAAILVVAGALLIARSGDRAPTA